MVLVDTWSSKALDTLFLNSGCPLNHPGSLLKYHYLGPGSRDSDVIDLR